MTKKDFNEKVKVLEDIFTKRENQKDKEQLYILALTNVDYKKFFKKAQNKPFKWDDCNFYIKDDLLYEKNRPALCVPQVLYEKIMKESFDSFIPTSPAAQMALFFCEGNHKHELYTDILTDIKASFECGFYRHTGTLPHPEGKSKEGLGLVVCDWSGDMKESIKPGTTLVIPTKVYKGDVLVTHSKVGMKLIEDITDQDCESIGLPHLKEAVDSIKAQIHVRDEERKHLPSIGVENEKTVVVVE